MSRIPYRALMRPQRTPPVQRPGFFLAPPVPVAASVAPEPAPIEPLIEQPVVGETAIEPVVEAAPEPVGVPETPAEVVAAPEPVALPSEPEPAPVPARVIPKVNSASGKTDLLAAAAALGLADISATNTRVEIWAAIQAATP
jgi:hypothetical protein